MTTLRFPIVAFAYLFDRLRRMPGGRWTERHVVIVVTVLMLGAGVSLFVWGSQKSPQRIDLPGLAYGQLSRMQSWIIISGDLGNEAAGANEYRYRLTDPAVPNAELIVVSTIQRPLGQTTLSGTYVGTRSPLAGDFRWIGQMHADVELAKEQDPPWVTIGLILLATLVGVGSRTTYPTLFRQAPRARPVRHASLRVGVRRGPRTDAGPVFAGSLVTAPGAPVELRAPGRDPLLLRLHSEHSLDVGELRRLWGSQPAMLLHLPTDEMTLTFASDDDRDAANAAMTADVKRG